MTPSGLILNHLTMLYSTYIIQSSGKSWRKGREAKYYKTSIYPASENPFGRNYVCFFLIAINVEIAL